MAKIAFGLVRVLEDPGAKQRGRVDNLSRGAKTALEGAGIRECFPQVGEFSGQTLDGRYLCADPRSQGEARHDGRSVDQYRAGAALTASARFLCTGQPEILSEDLQECRIGCGTDLLCLAIYRQPSHGDRGRCGRGSRWSKRRRHSAARS